MRSAAAVAAAAAALFTSAVLAQQPHEMVIASLRGVRTVNVVIEHLPASAVAVGVDSAALQNAIELRLRSAGLIVLGFGARDDGAIAVQITPMRAGSSGLWAYTLRVDFVQGTTLLREPHEVVFSSTWHDEELATVGANHLTDEIRKSVDKYMDEFINNWLEANPVTR